MGYTDILYMIRIYNPVTRKITQHRDIIIDETRRWGQRLIAVDDNEDTAEIIIEGDFLTEYPDKVENNDQLITVSSREAEPQPDKSEGEPRDIND